MLTVRGFRPSERTRQLAGRGERRSVHAPRKPLGDLLQQPNIAVGIAERGIRTVGTTLGIWPRSAPFGACVKAAAEATAGIVEHLADCDTFREELIADGIESVTARTRRSIEPGWAEVIPLPKMIDASDPGGLNSMIR